MADSTSSTTTITATATITINPLEVYTTNFDDPNRLALATDFQEREFARARTLRKAHIIKRKEFEHQKELNSTVAYTSEEAQLTQKSITNTLDQEIQNQDVLIHQYLRLEERNKYISVEKRLNQSRELLFSSITTHVKTQKDSLQAFIDTKTTHPHLQELSDRLIKLLVEHTEQNNKIFQLIKDVNEFRPPY
jgi:hypothetical protein